MGVWSIREDEHGFACAIEADGWTIIHLQAGTSRNEQWARKIVDAMNWAGVPAPAARTIKAMDGVESLGPEGGDDE